jgi:hypothetical protein
VTGKVVNIPGITEYTAQISPGMFILISENLSVNGAEASPNSKAGKDQSSPWFYQEETQAPRCLFMSKTELTSAELQIICGWSPLHEM